MKTVFYILVSIKTANGFETIGKFYVTDNRKAATNLFKQLKGSEQIDSNAILTLELVEMVDELPTNMLIKSCTLRELGENCKLIIREAFKQVNLNI